MSKLYKKQIRPMISPPALHGQVWHAIPFEHCENEWYDEELKELVTETYTKRIDDSWSSLIFDERYVEVEMPEPKVVDYKLDSMVLLQFDVNKMDVKTATDILHLYEAILPETVTVALLPNMECTSLTKEQAQLWLEEFRKKVEDMKDGEV